MKILGEIIYEFSRFVIKLMNDLGIFFVYAVILLFGVEKGYLPGPLAGLFLLAIFLVKLGVFDMVYNNFRRRIK